ncbi:hypothetical protein J7I91_11125 [Pseudomonas sp. ISL-84]|nr:hypothetical protein [Pseudomonas sp. ISL-84]
MQNAIVFMLFSILTIVYGTLLNLQLAWIDVTKDSSLFLFYLLNRNIIRPLIILIFINVFIGGKSLKNKVLIFIGMFLFLQLMDTLSQFLGVVTYTKWNLLYAGIANCVFLMLGLGLSKGVYYLKRESSMHDNSL